MSLERRSDELELTAASKTVPCAVAYRERNFFIVFRERLTWHVSTFVTRLSSGRYTKPARKVSSQTFRMPYPSYLQTMQHLTTQFSPVCCHLNASSWLSTEQLPQLTVTSGYKPISTRTHSRLTNRMSSDVMPLPASCSIALNFRRRGEGRVLEAKAGSWR
jgi:hypothetical protein